MYMYKSLLKLRITNTNTIYYSNISFIVHTLYLFYRIPQTQVYSDLFN